MPTVPQVTIRCHRTGSEPRDGLWRLPVVSSPHRLLVGDDGAEVVDRRDDRRRCVRCRSNKVNDPVDLERVRVGPHRVVVRRDGHSSQRFNLSDGDAKRIQIRAELDSRPNSRLAARPATGGYGKRPE